MLKEVMKRIGFAKTIICIFVLLLMQTQVLANPIPVFYAFGALDEDNIKSNSMFSIYERDGDNNEILRRYSISGSSIYERDGDNNKILKRYSISGSSIYERDGDNNKILKRYQKF